ncbi:MAG: MarR family transcriptional regulator [Dermatophilaceae bacterium]
MSTPRVPTDLPSANTALLLARAHGLIDAVVPLRLADHGHGAVRPAHGVVFQHLDESGTTVNTLAKRARMTKQAMAGLVAHLEAHGYVRREPSEDDRRAKLVRLTDPGREVLALVARWVPEMEDRIGQALGEARRQQLRRDLAVICRVFEDPESLREP